MNRKSTILSQAALVRVAAIFALMAGSVFSLRGQTATVPTEPLASVQKFKQVIDDEDLQAMCQLMSEPDSSGPLARSNYEAMQASLEGLISLWKGATFSYGAVVSSGIAVPPTATVPVVISALRQRAVFSLLRFNGAWYIRDVEVYFQ